TAVGIRVDGDRPDAHLPAGPDHPDRDLASVGHENLAKHGRFPPRRSIGALSAPWKGFGIFASPQRGWRLGRRTISAARSGSPARGPDRLRDRGGGPPRLDRGGPV